MSTLSVIQDRHLLLIKPGVAQYQRHIEAFRKITFPPAFPQGKCFFLQRQEAFVTPFSDHSWPMWDLFRHQIRSKPHISASLYMMAVDAAWPFFVLVRQFQQTPQAFQSYQSCGKGCIYIYIWGPFHIPPNS